MPTPGEILAGIQLGDKSSAWFTANASYPLKKGQIVFLDDDSGQFKKGDGIRTVGELPWLGGSGEAVFENDILVSLSGGKTFGQFANGETIPAQGKTAAEVIELAAIEDIAPTYTPATNVLSETLSVKAEVGTSYSNTLTATFTKNDAGNLTGIKIQKNGVDLSAGAASPLISSDSGVYVLGSISYTAYADYLAGSPKNYLPSGDVDERTPAIRNVNAPQAAESNFASNAVTLPGAYKIFFGPNSGSITPVSSAAVRLLTSAFDDASSTVVLNTGSSERSFSICMRATKNLVSVIDLDALNADVTSGYILSTFNVNDAGGSPVSFHIYTMTNAGPYSANHRHQFNFA